jgi:hypothetical protein
MKEENKKESVSIYNAVSRHIKKTVTFKKLKNSNRASVSMFINIQKTWNSFGGINFQDFFKDISEEKSLLKEEFSQGTILLVMLCICEIMDNFTDCSVKDFLMFQNTKKVCLLEYCRAQLSKEELLEIIVDLSS